MHPRKAFAVMAMMGSVFASGRLSERMVFAASMPFITGIITSMRTASNVSGGLFCTISTACLPSVTTVTVAPSSVSRICAISALSALSSTSSSLQC